MYYPCELWQTKKTLKYCYFIILQIPDDICEGLTNRTAMNSEMIYCKQDMHDNLCNVCNVTPKDAPKGVQAQKVLHPDKDVFLLKIGKQTDEPNRTGNIVVCMTIFRKFTNWKHSSQNETPKQIINMQEQIEIIPKKGNKLLIHQKLGILYGIAVTDSSP